MNATAREILHRLADLGAKVERQGDKLLLEAGAAPVPSDVLTLVREHKAEVLEALAKDVDRDNFDERAALIEEGAKVPRAWAEGFARLDPDRPPRDVTAKRWCEIVNGIGIFLDRWANSSRRDGMGRGRHLRRGRSPSGGHLAEFRATVVR